MTYEAFKQNYNIALNEQQERAVQTVDGPVLLLAVPGSGKTTVLVTRLGYMIYGRGIPPEKILTMTYTVSATRDMRSRFAALFGEEMAKRLEFRTINGVSARIIRCYEQLYQRRAFELLGEEKELSALVGEIYRRVLREFPTESDIKGIRSAITYAKNSMLDRDEIKAMEKEVTGFSRIYQEYNHALKTRGCMDYDDQMVYAYQILRKYPEVLRIFQENYHYLCVDEAQDTSKIQHKIIGLLSAGRGNLFLVGDEDQSIYGFRAAYPKALLEFEQTHPGAQVLLMERNYRSTKQIAAAADRFIRQNEDRHPKHMTAVRGKGKAIGNIKVFDRKHQYSYLLKVAQGCTRETAVLYRDNDCALPLIDLLERNGVPYRCRQMDGSFFTHRIVRDITDIIHLSKDQSDGEAFLRVYYKLNAGIRKEEAENAVRCRDDGESIFARLGEDTQRSEWSRSRCRAIRTHLEHMREERGDKAVYRILNFIGYGEYLEKNGIDPNRAHILEALGKQEPTPFRLLARLEELRTILQERGGDSKCPFVLSTVHSSKGLEYERVILMDVLDGIFPKEGETADETEERRLFYVAMTRARDELSVFTFQKMGRKSTFSDFLFPEQKAEQPKKTARLSSSAELYQSTASVKKVTLDIPDCGPGTQIKHRSFGAGTIVARDQDFVTAVFADGTTRKLSLRVSLQMNLLEILQ